MKTVVLATRNSNSTLQKDKFYVEEFTNANNFQPGFESNVFPLARVRQENKLKKLYSKLRLY